MPESSGSQGRAGLGAQWRLMPPVLVVIGIVYASLYWLTAYLARLAS